MRSSDWSSDVCSSDLIAWLDRAFRRLQANGEALDGARDLIERNREPFEAGRCRRFFGGLRSEERRVGNACLSTCRPRRSPCNEQITNCSVTQSNCINPTAGGKQL